ncbi:MAG: CapA family protein [Oscillospiraceae bacterium]|nr:CapA family protein [Oscillospiraceae bacterium]
MKRLLIVFLLLLTFLLYGCSAAPTNASEPYPELSVENQAPTQVTPTPIPSPTPTPIPTPEPEPEPIEIRIQFAGDILLHRGPIDAARIGKTRMTSDPFCEI